MLNKSHSSTGLIEGVGMREEDTERYTEVSTIMQVMFTVMMRSSSKNVQ